MQTTIKQVTPVEYELEIHASADDLAAELDKALRAQRARTVLKGFRQGKVPLPLVKKMYGKALALELAGKAVQDAYEAEVLKPQAHEVLGQPRVTTFDYEMDRDLHAVLQFGVRPEFDLKDLSEETLPKLAHEVNDDEVDTTIERLRKRRSEYVAHEAEAGEEDLVVVDMQRLDDQTKSPLVGEREVDVSFQLDDEHLLDELKTALVGKKAGDTLRVTLPHHHDHEEELHSDLIELPGAQRAHSHEPHSRTYEVTVKEVKRQDLVELDPAFFKEVTGSELDDEAAFRAEVARQLTSSWDRQARELLQAQIVDRMRALHPVAVPESVVDMFLDSFVEDVRQRSKGGLPEGFDEQAFREANRQEAEDQGRWMLIRDKVIDEAGLAVTDEDLDAYFEREAGDSAQIDAAQLRQVYQRLGMLDRIEQRLLADKVFDTLATRFKVEEMNEEAFEQALEEERQPEAEAAEAASKTTE